MHPFFEKILQYPELAKCCDLEAKVLPKEYKGNSKIKAILLGADPTNNGTKNNKRRILLKTVFGINEYKEFFSPQDANLKAINLDKENLYIQNVCRNYFIQETAKNKKWNEVADLWIEYLIEELDDFDPDRKVPVLATSEVIMKLLLEDVPKAREVYNNCLSFEAEKSKLYRKTYAFYRHPSYYIKLHDKYRDFLIKNI